MDENYIIRVLARDLLDEENCSVIALERMRRD